jgi:NAD(P)-dependent dehydrogenase (short-subunit alcohol dehydrogenase family)
MSVFKGTTSVITGGADGIGLALAKAIGQRGGKVALLDIRGDAANEAAEALKAQGIDAAAFHCDVTERARVEESARQVVERFGGVNLAWMNAGVGSGGHLNSAALDQIEWVHAVNITGVINTVRALWPLVEQAKGLRHLGFTGSSIIYGHGEAYPHGLYASSKWATVGIAESLVGRAEKAGIGTTIFNAGLLNTRIWDGARARPDRFGGPAHQPEEAGNFWREQGMPVDWACEQAINAIESGERYCSPVFQRIIDDFDARTDLVRKSFIVYPGPSETIEREETHQ